MEIRYYAITSWGRARLEADTLEKAAAIVRAMAETHPQWLPIRLVKEVRATELELPRVG
jgi:hypothetical protein